MNKRDENGHCRPVPDPRGKAFSLMSIHVTEYDSRCRLFVDALYHAEEFPCYFKLVESLCHE